MYTTFTVLRGLNRLTGSAETTSPLNQTNVSPIEPLKKEYHSSNQNTCGASGRKVAFQNRFLEAPVAYFSRLTVRRSLLWGGCLLAVDKLPCQFGGEGGGAEISARILFQLQANNRLISNCQLDSFPFSENQFLDVDDSRLRIRKQHRTKTSRAPFPKRGGQGGLSVSTAKVNLKVGKLFHPNMYQIISGRGFEKLANYHKHRSKERQVKSGKFTGYMCVYVDISRRHSINPNTKNRAKKIVHDSMFHKMYFMSTQDSNIFRKYILPENLRISEAYVWLYF